MTNNDNTFIIVLEQSKIPSFEQLSTGKNYYFQNCKENNILQGSVLDSEFGHFYKTKLESLALFCVIKISQNKFLELEKIVNVLEGAIESIDWPKQNEIIAFDPNQKKSDLIDDQIFVTPDVRESTLNIFFVILTGLVMHDIWSGFIMLAFGIVGGLKKNEDNQKWIYGGVFSVLIGIICNSLMGNLAMTKLGEKTSEFYAWISNLQLIEIFTKNNVLPLNQLLEQNNWQLIYFYFGLIVSIGIFFQLVKYILEMILNRKIFRLQFSVLRFFWICLILTFSIAAYFYFYNNFKNNLIWIPAATFVFLTLVNQRGNKIKNFLVGNYGILEILKVFLKIIPFGLLAIIGILSYWLTREINSMFAIYLGEGWDFSKILFGVTISQSIIGYIFCWIVFWGVKLTLKLVK